MEPSRKAQLSLALITLAGLAPFLNKQFNIDDPLFLWTAQQIAAHPLDPFGFSVNWTGAPEPMWHAMQNPPLCSCFIASVASVFGWSEVILHAAFLPWAVAAVLGTFTLGQRFCRNLDFQSVRPAPKAFRLKRAFPAIRASGGTTARRFMFLSPRRCLLCSLQPFSSPPPASCAMSCSWHSTFGRWSSGFAGSIKNAGGFSHSRCFSFPPLS